MKESYWRVFTVDAPTCVLKTINHEEPDRVPAYEAFTNNSIMNHYGVPTSVGLSFALRVLKYLPFKDRIAYRAIRSPKFLVKSYADLYEFLRRVKVDIGISLVTHIPRKIRKNGYIDEYGRIIEFEPYERDGAIISAYHGGYFTSFEDYESWERPDSQDPIRLAAYHAGKEAQAQKNNEVLSVPSIGGMMEPSWEVFGLERFSCILSCPKQARKIFDDHGKLAVELTKILGD